MSKSITYSVYCITCTPLSLSYVGVTVSLKSRIAKHLHELRSKRHHNKEPQLAFDQYGEPSFQVHVLEVGVFGSKISAREKHWIKQLDTFNAGFNLTKGGMGSQPSPDPMPLQLTYYDDTIPQSLRERYSREEFERMDDWSPQEEREERQLFIQMMIDNHNRRTKRK